MEMGDWYDVSPYITSELASNLDHAHYDAPVGGAVFHPVSWLEGRPFCSIGIR
jgi:hypothetical protein